MCGANGSGKTVLLEAIGMLSAALNGRVDNSALQGRGVRLGTPQLYPPLKVLKLNLLTYLLIGRINRTMTN